MKQGLKEELLRIHELTYGKNLINEENFLDRLFSGNLFNKTNKVDDPKKADLVSDNVKEFFKSLEDSANSGGVSQQKIGSMSYQKAVESMQIGLLILGYQLPRFGVDGLFGPETGNAVKNFINDKIKSPINNPQDKTSASKEVLLKMIELLKGVGVSSEDLKNHIDPEITTGGGGVFSDINVLTPEGFNIYADISQKFINTKNANAGITGDMMANGAKIVMERYGKYVPPELALAQLFIEGGLSRDPNARPIKTNNPFNVGNTDNGVNIGFSSKQEGINQYYSLIARSYLVKGRTANNLVRNFVNRNDDRYASSGNYENMLNKIALEVNHIASPMLSSDNQNLA